MQRDVVAGVIHSVCSIVGCCVLWAKFGFLIAALAGMLLSQVGLMRFFPLLYALYCNHVSGRFLSSYLHPRMPRSHSNLTSCDAVNGVKILPVPVLADNYAYLVICEETQKAVVIDPGDPAPVLQTVQHLQVSLEAILITHKHWDHCGGAGELRESLSNKPDVVGSKEDAPFGLTKSIADGEEIAVGNLRLVALLVPGHTSHHLIFKLRHATIPGRSAVFSGDSLFCGGCGAFFEADVAGLARAFAVYGGMPGDTLVFPGHEYTEMLLRKEHARDPANEVIRRSLDRAVELREQKNPTVPSTMEEQRLVNPFLRLAPECFRKRDATPVHIMMEMSKTLSTAPSEGGG